MVLEKTPESPLDSKEIKPVNPKGNQPWIFIGRTDAEAQALVVWSTDMKSRVIVKVPDTWKDWGQKRASEDEMAGWHHWCNGHELGQTPGDGEGQGVVACCTPGVAKSRTWLGAWTTYVSYILIKWEEEKNKVQLFRKPFQGIQDKFLCPSLVSSSTLTPQPSHVLYSKNALLSSLYSSTHLVTLLMLSSPTPQFANSLSSSTRYILLEVLRPHQSALPPALDCNACPPRLSPVQFFHARDSVLFICPIWSVKIC